MYCVPDLNRNSNKPNCPELVDDIEQETEEEEEEKARTSGILILNIAYKTNLLVK